MRKEFMRILNTMYGVLYNKYDEWKAGKPPKSSKGHVARSRSM